MSTRWVGKTNVEVEQNNLSFEIDHVSPKYSPMALQAKGHGDAT
jgi:hypothetical protein